MEESNERFHKSCLISGSGNLQALKGYEQHYLVKSHPVGFVFASKIPTDEDLIKHYKNYGRSDQVSPITIKRYNELLDDFEQYRKTGKILDIGCDVGHFLKEAKKRGWEVYGTEFTDEAISKCVQQGIQTFQGKLKAEWFAPEMFDIVTSFEVIEHINNPVEEVINVNKILRKNGLFYVTTPNFNSIERFILKDKYQSVIQYPEHLSYYTKKTLNYLLSNNGFEKVKITTTGFSFTAIKNGLSTRKEKRVAPTSTDQVIRAKMESNKLLHVLKIVTNRLLNILSLGSSMKAWYVKK